MKKGAQETHLGKRILFITSICILSAMMYLITWQTYTDDIKLVPPLVAKGYFVETEGCHIPKLDPFHPSVAHLNQPATPIVCIPKKPPLVVQGANRLVPHLIFLEDRRFLYGTNVSCFYQAIHRVTDEESALNATVHDIDQEVVLVRDDFIMVNCVDAVNGRSVQVFEDFFAFIQKKPEVEKRVREIMQRQMEPKPGEKLSVLLLAIDSVAKSHFHRLMVKTEKFLREEVDMIEMFGYNKIGKNTFPVMLPFLTGLIQTEVNVTKDKPLDFLPFVWKDYVNASFRTFFSEDNANTAIFHYNRKGFKDQPADYYWRPLKIAFQCERFGALSSYGCIKGRSEAVSILNYTLDFFDTFPNDPVFALTLLSYFTHDYLNTLSRYDEPYLNFLQQMNDKNHLNRTIVLFFSDHGFRFGESRRTYMGRMEGKLPFLFILVPSWFKNKFPKIINNLKQNANRLISTLDLHAVLKDLVHFNSSGSLESQTNDRGHSVNLLRTVVSEKRTCREAKIPLQYCACMSMQQIPVTVPQVLDAALQLVDKINDFIAPFSDRCSTLKLVKIHSAASQAIAMDETLDSIKSSLYQVTIQVKPGHGIFEGSVWHLDDGDVYTAEPNIERVNRYGNQSDCIIESAIKPFCYCR